MKHIISVVAALCLATALFADVSLVTESSRATESVVKFTLDEYQVDTVNVDGESYVTVSVPGFSGKTIDKDKPELPFKSVNLLVTSENPSLEIVSVKYKSISVLPVLPSKGSLKRNVNPANIPVVKGDIYAKDLWFPENVAKLSPVYQVRSVKGITVQISPFLYNPATGILKIAEEIILSVKGAGKTPRSATGETSEEFKTLIQERFLNVTSSRYTPVNDGDKMIIITTEGFKEAVQPLVTWKNQKGIETAIHIYPTETGNDTTGIKKFIKDKYDSDKISYVLFVGDGELVPTVTMPSGEEGMGFDATITTDPMYGMVAGDDLYVDLFVGRLTAKNSEEVTTMINKILTYEKSPQESADWYGKALSIGSDEGTPKDYEWFSDSINPALTTYGYSCELIKPGSGTGNDAVTKINEGRSLVNYMGHGDYSALSFSQFSLDTNQIKSMTNGDKLPVVIPLACLYGNFIGREAPAEYWLRNKNGGAVVIVASSPLMAWTEPQYAQVEMNRLIAKDKHSSFGAYFYNGCMQMLDQSSKNDNSKRTAKTWIYYGDPSLQLFTKAPKKLSVTRSRGVIQSGSNNITFKTETGARVTVSKDDKILASKVVSGGEATLAFDAAKGDKITITVTMRNRIPNIEMVDVTGTSILTESLSSSDLAPSAIRRDQMLLSVPQQGAYSITLLSVNGRVLHNGTYSLRQGTQRIALQQILPRGAVVIAKISGSTTNIVKRMLVQ